MGLSCRRFFSSCKLNRSALRAFLLAALTYKVRHLDVLQPLGIDLQTTPVLSQDEVVHIANVPLLFLQR